MTKTPSIRATVLAVSLALSCLLPSGGARAGIIAIDDLTDSLSISDGTGGRLLPASGCVGEVCTISFLSPQDPLGNNPSSSSGGPARTNIFGPNGIISDTLEQLPGTNIGGRSVNNFRFISDSELGGLTPLPQFAASITEDGTFLNIFSVTWVFANSPSIVDTIQIRSDPTPEVRVPEPASLALLALGLAGLGWSRRKQA